MEITPFINLQPLKVQRCKVVFLREDSDLQEWSVRRKSRHFSLVVRKERAPERPAEPFLLLLGSVRNSLYGDRRL